MRIIEVDAPAALSVACPAALLATGVRERIALECVAGVERVAKQITGHRGILCYWHSGAIPRRMLILGGGCVFVL
jgi:hypothetical protein